MGRIFHKVYRFLDAEVRNKKFHLFFLNVSRAEGGTLEHDLYHWWYLIIFTVALLVTNLMRFLLTLNTFKEYCTHDFADSRRSELETAGAGGNACCSCPPFSNDRLSAGGIIQDI